VLARDADDCHGSLLVAPPVSVDGERPPTPRLDEHGDEIRR
jgi:hypothetical protein